MAQQRRKHNVQSRVYHGSMQQSSGEIFDCHFAADLLLSMLVKEFETKSPADAGKADRTPRTTYGIAADVVWNNRLK